MSKTGKKSNTSFTQAQVMANAMKTFEEVCGKLVGPGTYEKFHKHCVIRLLANRYGPVKLVMGPDAGRLKAIFPRISAQLVRGISEHFITLDTGVTISLAAFLREGITLINYVSMMQRENRGLNPELLSAFHPYCMEKRGYENVMNELTVILLRITILFSDYSKYMITFSMKELSMFTGAKGNNKLPLNAIRLPRINLRIEDKNREMIQIGWINSATEFVGVKILPHKIGFFNSGKDQTADIYIQQHALQRLEERLGLLPGLIHFSIYACFAGSEIKWHRYNEKVLVTLHVFSQKVGYLVCSFDQGMVIIRSFLFLTNSGTPEGELLRQLTKLQPADKNYLGIDTLAGFSSFSFHNDTRLSALFSEAGCADLLNLDHLLPFLTTNITENNSEKLLKYMEGIGPLNMQDEV